MTTRWRCLCERYLWRLQQLNLVAHLNRAACDHACTDATATLQRLRHTHLGKALDVPADRVWPSVLERNLPDTEPLATSHSLQIYTSDDDIAPVLAIDHTHSGLSFDVVEVLGRDEGYFADPTEAAPVTSAFTVTVTLEAAAFQGGGRLDTLHLRPAFRCEENPFNEAHHYWPPFESCFSLSMGFRFPRTVISHEPLEEGRRSVSRASPMSNCLSLGGLLDGPLTVDTIYRPTRRH